MRVLILSFLMILSFSVHAEEAATEKEPARLARWYNLVEFAVDTTGMYPAKDDRPAGGLMVCDEASVADIDHKDQRFLIPSYQPFKRKASWAVDKCKALEPYFDTLGFSSFDSETGRATIYISHSTVDLSSVVNHTDADGVGYVADVDDFVDKLNTVSVKTMNVLEFSAQCTFTVQGYWASYTYDNQLDCTLDKGRGHVSLTYKDLDVSQVPQDLPENLLHDYPAYTDGAKAPDLVLQNKN